MLGQRAGTARFFCAVCGDDIDSDAPRQAPLGKRGAMVNVCIPCDEDRPRERQGPKRYYDGSMSNERAQQAISEIARERSAGFRAKFNAEETAIQRTPGWILLRVPRLPTSGVTIDAIEAAQKFEGEPWYGELYYLGNSRRFYLFERPDPRIPVGERARSSGQLVSRNLWPGTGG